MSNKLLLPNCLFCFLEDFFLFDSPSSPFFPKNENSLCQSVELRAMERSKCPFNCSLRMNKKRLIPTMRYLFKQILWGIVTF